MIKSKMRALYSNSTRFDKRRHSLIPRRHASIRPWIITLFRALSAWEKVNVTSSEVDNPAIDSQDPASPTDRQM